MLDSFPTAFKYGNTSFCKPKSRLPITLTEYVSNNHECTDTSTDPIRVMLPKLRPVTSLSLLSNFMLLPFPLNSTFLTEIISNTDSFKRDKH